MRVYIVGCGGMLGEAVYKYFTEKGHTVLATDKYRTEPWLDVVDVRSYHAMHYDVSNFRPGVIINLAALTDLEECETTFAGEAIETNTGGSANCVALASKFCIPYVYVSTAGIFDGGKGSYSDDDKPNPLCIYAKSKYWGELIAREHPQHIVMRCGWSMGSGPKDKKFINKIWKQIIAGATELNVVQDKLGTPTYVKDFAKQMNLLLQRGFYGVFNAVGRGSASRYDVAVEFVRLLGLQDRIKVNVVPSSFWKHQYFAPRPASEKLLTDRLDRLGLNVMQPWQDGLAQYLEEYRDYFTLPKEAK
jgi:dTDP-4-dehydrorhamnose reductase